ncbi:hypothetical protein TRICI_003691 [Trichomonascus ciferrii]|uniref:Sin3 binding protein n=1 Tax=Trichomonascus ciferrii TaxID=44093 RepID=A0A642V2I1_9ASCO|nr:hypothetical protein TRICI_003691 [Trichomonascus ciferrii]
MMAHHQQQQQHYHHQGTGAKEISLSPTPGESVHQIPTPPQSYSSTGSSPMSTSRVYHNGSGGHRSTSRRRLSSSSTSSKDGNGPLNTNSPIALAAAAAVTPEKLAKLLLTQGPLAIRHITSHLALTIPGFADLSLSKQRRLIIAVLDNEDPVNGVIFEKVGWGRWAARRTDGSGSPQPHPHHVTAHQPYTKSKRRESITAGDLVKPPVSPSLNPVFGDDVDLADDDMMFHNKPNNDHYRAVFDDDDDDEDDDALEDSDDEDGLRKPYHHRRSSSRRHSSIARHAVSQHHRNNHRHSETDEEDWQSIGAASLRRNSHSPASFGFSTSYTRNHNVPFDSQKEKEAVDALVQLSSI